MRIALVPNGHVNAVVVCSSSIEAQDYVVDHIITISALVYRCWSALGPLLCAVAYRPCSNRSYFELTMTKPGFMEMWQVFRKDMCHRAMGLCAFVVDGGLWPSFVNCSHSSANKIGRQLFSDGSC
uniref:Frizzled/Smoothened transmembrane domain-containing protein n=1 Tax=Parascaris univalens TaxID=6257 RepID=A0A915A8Y8_PARUN